MSARAQQAEAEIDEIARLIRNRIEGLRPKLLDLTRRNPLISTSFAARSTSHIRVVDELPDVLSFQLGNQTQMRLLPLPALDDEPKDEQTRRFQNALSNALLTDDHYLDTISRIDPSDSDALERQRGAERDLRDRIRAHFGMPDRQTTSNLSLAEHARINGISPSYDLPDPADENADGRHNDAAIQTLLLPDDLDRKLNALTTKCRTWIQETGINVLHAAFGFVEWSEKNSTSKCFSPLVLLPIDIEKRKTKDGLQFWIQGNGDDPETNAILAEKLRMELGLTLPLFSGGSIEEYVTQVSSLSPQNFTWKVRRQIAIGVFPSARMAMYQDLDPDGHDFQNQEIVSALLGGNPALAGATPFAPNYNVDEPEIERKVPVLALDADSSQFSALVDLANGQNLALEGPPGTGKSQTIVNAIASALESGKSILFVAEKTAALNVVKSRLEAIGLGDFLLPLQADRSTRELVVKSVKSRLEAQIPSSPIDYQRSIDDFRNTREQIREYIDIISSEFSETGFTVHDIIGRSVALSPALKTTNKALLRPKLHKPESYDGARIERLREAANVVEHAWENTKTSQSYWESLAISGIDKIAADEILEHADQAANSFEKLHSTETKLRSLGFQEPFDVEKLKDVERICNALAPLQRHFDTSLLEKLLDEKSFVKINKFLDDCESFRTNCEEIGRFVNNPTDNNWPERLRSLASYCEKYQISSLSMRAIKYELEEHKSKFSKQQELLRLLEPIAKEWHNIAEWPFADLRAAYKLTQGQDRAILTLRSEALAGEDAEQQVVRFIKDGVKLRDQRDELAQSIETHTPLSPREMQEAAAQLRGANTLSLFSSEFRRAKKLYRSISKRPQFSSDEAASDLSALAQWRSNEERFCSDPAGRRFFGLHFRELETDYSAFEKLITFYAVVDDTFKGPAKRELRHFLKTAPLDLITSLPDLADETSDNLNELSASILATEQRIEQLENALSKIDLYTEEIKIGDLKISDIMPLIGRIEELLLNRNQLENCDDVRKIIGDRHRGPATSGSTLERELIAARAILRLNDDRSTVLNLIENEKLANASHSISQYLCRTSEAAASIDLLSSQSGISTDRLNKEPSAMAVARRLRSAAQDYAGLIAHSAYFQAREELRREGGDWIVDILIRSEASLHQLADTVEATIAQGLAVAVFECHRNILTRYPGKKLNHLRQQLASLDRKIIKMSRQHLRATLFRRSNPPIGVGRGPKSTWTELSLLQNEASKQKRFIAVRDMTVRAGQALQQLKPCWMMSPLSVAQYLPRGAVSFDLVIIDEASQMPPEDALGALVRGGQAMIVGDTNQLPPTSFFKKLVDDEDKDEDEAVVEESILEMANAAFRPPRRLRWHYRSRNSDLIRFSNQIVYNNDLVVFPSAAETGVERAVSLVSVEGSYSSGTNAAEVNEIVDAALVFMKNHPDQSLGIVVLNQKQRDLLIEAMDHALAADHRASRYVESWKERNDGLESFFIKNLENVQGDERDVIFIGTVYGPERPGGPVAQRFGPINGIAGRRRLNVLFSRAKHRIVTFSSMTSSDIRSDEDSNPGTYMLKLWLEYSASGLLQSPQNIVREPDSPFEEFVMAQIRAMGCEAVAQVGAAGYFVDIGVKHPEWPYGYVLGVECDGASYHSSKSARDRDRLRQEILEDLGWEFHRIWSTDWFNDPQGQASILRDRINERVKILREGTRATTRKADEVRSNIDVEKPRTTLAPAPDSIQSLTVDKHDVSETGIRVGDRVRVRYLGDGGPTLEITLSDQCNDPDQGIISIREPLGNALLESDEGEEIEVLIGAYVKRALVEKVTRQ